MAPVLIALTLHEMAHVIMATALGVRVKRIGIAWRGPYIVRESGEPKAKSVYRLSWTAYERGSSDPVLECRPGVCTYQHGSRFVQPASYSWVRRGSGSGSDAGTENRTGHRGLS